MHQSLGGTLVRSKQRNSSSGTRPLKLLWYQVPTLGMQAAISSSATKLGKRMELGEVKIPQKICYLILEAFPLAKVVLCCCKPSAIFQCLVGFCFARCYVSVCGERWLLEIPTLPHLLLSPCPIYFNMHI